MFGLILCLTKKKKKDKLLNRIHTDKEDRMGTSRQRDKPHKQSFTVPERQRWEIVRKAQD